MLDPSNESGAAGTIMCPSAERNNRFVGAARKAVCMTFSLVETSTAAFTGRPSRFCSSATANTSSTRSVAWLKALPSVAIHAISALSASRVS